MPSISTSSCVSSSFLALSWSTPPFFFCSRNDGNQSTQLIRGSKRCSTMATHRSLWKIADQPRRPDKPRPLPPWRRLKGRWVINQVPDFLSSGRHPFLLAYTCILNDWGHHWWYLHKRAFCAIFSCAFLSRGPDSILGAFYLSKVL